MQSNKQKNLKEQNQNEEAIKILDAFIHKNNREGELSRQCANLYDGVVCCNSINTVITNAAVLLQPG